MKVDLGDTPQLAKSDQRTDTLDIVLTRLSGAAHHLQDLSYVETIHVVKAKAESWIESEARANGDLDPSECYELGLTFNDDILRDDWTLRETGLQTGDVVSVLCMKGDRRRRATSRLVDAVLKKEFIQVDGFQSELRLIQEQQHIERDPVIAAKQTLVADLLLLLEESMEDMDFVRMSEIQAVIRFIVEQRDVPNDPEACLCALNQFLDEAMENKECAETADIQAEFLRIEEEGKGSVAQERDVRMDPSVVSGFSMISRRRRRKRLSNEIIENREHAKIRRTQEEADVWRA